MDFGTPLCISSKSHQPTSKDAGIAGLVVVAFIRNRHKRTTMNLTFDLPIVVGTHPRKAQESRVREMARRGRDMARTRSVHSQPKQHGPDNEEAKTLLDLNKQYIRLYYSCIAKRLGVREGSQHGTGRCLADQIHTGHLTVQRLFANSDIGGNRVWSSIQPM